MTPEELDRLRKKSQKLPDAKKNLKEDLKSSSVKFLEEKMVNKDELKTLKRGGPRFL